MSRPSIALNVSLPADLVRLLADHGNDLIHALEMAIVVARQQARQVNAEADDEAISRRIEERLAELTRFGGSIYWIFQNRLAARGQGLGGKQRQALRRALYHELAAENGVVVEYVEMALRRYSNGLGAILRTHQDIQILRLAAAGVSNQEIAARVRFNTLTVSRKIAKFQEKAASEGLSLSALSDLWASQGAGRE